MSETVDVEIIPDDEGTDTPAVSESGANESVSTPQQPAAQGTPNKRPGKLERRIMRFEQELSASNKALIEERNARLALQHQLFQTHVERVKEWDSNLQANEKHLLATANAAMNAGDTETHTAAMAKLSEVKAAQNELNREKERLRIQDEKQRQPVKQETQYSKEAKAWLDANPWFGKNAPRTKTAEALHEDAVERGIVPETPAYWKHLEDGIEKVFPGTVRRPADLYDSDDQPPVGSASQAQIDAEDSVDNLPATPATTLRQRSSAPPNNPPSGARNNATTSSPPRETIRLSSAQVEIAKSIGVTPQQYAAGLKKAAAEGKLGERR